MKRSGSERGGAAAVIFWLVVLGISIYLGTKFLPPYVSSKEFVDAMDEQAADAGAGNLTDDQVKRALALKAKDLHLPVKEPDIHIRRTGGEVTIDTQYTVVIDLPFYGRYSWPFSSHAARPVLY